jgi:hypothetical protein
MPVLAAGAVGDQIACGGLPRCASRRVQSSLEHHTSAGGIVVGTRDGGRVGERQGVGRWRHGRHGRGTKARPVRPWHVGSLLHGRDGRGTPTGVRTRARPVLE